MTQIPEVSDAKANKSPKAKITIYLLFLDCIQATDSPMGRSPGARTSPTQDGLTTQPPDSIY